MSQLTELFKKPLWKSTKARVTAGSLAGILAGYLAGDLTSAQAILAAVAAVSGWTIARGIEDGGKANAKARIIAAKGENGLDSP